MILMIDNYDSFTWNLVQALWTLGQEVKVVRNDEVSLDEVAKMKLGGIVVSPGPCSPKEAGISVPVFQRFAETLPMLGVCLGHQSLGAAFAADVVRAPVPMHGKLSPVSHRQQGIFTGLPTPLTVTRYHSLIVKRESLPAALEVTATTDELIMGLQLVGKPVFGVQFHPESIKTDHGVDILRNFVRECAG